MKKTIFSLLMILALLLGCMGAAFAGDLTHYTGKVGFSIDYPADVLDVHASGINTTLVTKDEKDTMSITILPASDFSLDPVAKLLAYAKEYDHDFTAEDVQELTAASGAKVWKLSFPMTDNATVVAYVVQDGGRQFDFDVFVHNDCKDKYLALTDEIVLSFVNEPDGDMSGYEEEDSIEWEPDYYDTMLERYDEAIKQYATAVAEGWDAGKLEDAGMSSLIAMMGEAAADLNFSFINMNNKLPEQLLLYTPAGEDGTDIEVIALATLDENGKTRFLVSGSERDSFVLCGNPEEGYTLAEYASNSAAQSAVFFWRLNDNNELELIEGVLYDFAADAEHPCFLVKDTDFDAAKGTPCTEEEAEAVLAKYTTAKDVENFFTVRDYLVFDMGRTEFNNYD